MATGSTRFVIAALIGNAALAAAKFVAAGFSGSGAIFAEAVHSTVDAGNEALLLIGIQRAERPADERHSLGHGREIYLWSLVAAILPFGLGAGVSIARGFDRLDELRPLAHVGWIYLLLAAAAAFQAASWLAAWRGLARTRGDRPLLAALRRSPDPAHFPLLFGDTAALAGLAIAFLGVLASHRLGWLWADGAAALAIGALLALAAVLLLLETRGLLVGEAVEPHLVEDILGMAGRAGFVEGVNEVRTMHFGPADVLVNLSVDARDRLSAREVEAGVAALEAEIRGRHPEITRVFIEIQSAAGGPAPDVVPAPA